MVDGLKARPLPPNLRPEARVVDLSNRGSAAREVGVDGAGDGEGGEAAAAGGAGAGTAATLLGPEYRRSLKCPNPEETNSAVEITFQVRAAGWAGLGWRRRGRGRLGVALSNFCR